MSITPETPTPEPDIETPVPPKKRRSFLGIVLRLLLFAIVGFCGAAGYDAYTFLRTPADTAEPKDVIINIAPGATFDRVAWDLYKAKALTSVWRFRLLAQYHKKLGAIQSGEFQVNTGWTPEQLLQHLVSGRSLLYPLTLREGLPFWEVARLVEEGGFAKAAEFEAAVQDPAFLRANGIPFASAEGFLYPETYHLRKPRTLGGKEQAEAVARILVEMFWRRNWPLLTEYAATDKAVRGETLFLSGFALKNGLPVRLVPARAPLPAQPGRNATPPGNATRAEAAPAPRPESPPSLAVPVSAETLRYLVILGSLVEKETGVAAERDRVAGVYANRLRLNMLLQCDPTIIYGLGKEQSGPIRKSQLADAKNLYNTYQHAGLPPGPICSPGFASMRAAAHPEQHNYLYFVATGTNGTHTFSTNLNDHNQAVMRYRATQR